MKIDSADFRRAFAEYMREKGRKGGRNGTHADKVRAGKLGAASRWNKARLTETAQKI